MKYKVGDVFAPLTVITSKRTPPTIPVAGVRYTYIQFRAFRDAQFATPTSPHFGGRKRSWILRGKFGIKKMTGGPLGLPAEFLVGPDYRIKAAHYGKHAYDQWPVKTLFDLARDRDQ